MGLTEPVILKKNTFQSLEQTGRKIQAKNPGQKIRGRKFSVPKKYLDKFGLMAV